MAVRQRVGEGAVKSFLDIGGIFINRVLSNRVFDHLAVGLLVQLIPAVAPVVGGAQLDGLDDIAVRQQVHRHIIRTIAILVILVVPDLQNLHFGLFDLVRVRDCVGECTVFGLGDGCVILVYLVLGYRVDDILAFGFLVQLRPVVAPAVLLAQLDRINDLAVCQQVHCYVVRAVAILVVRVAPDLLDLHFGLFGLMAVRYRVGEGTVSSLIDLRGVLRHFVLGHRVVDFLARGLLVQLRPAVAPLVLLAQRDGVDDLTVRQQVDRYVFRTVAILVVLVVPDLRDIHHSLFSFVAVCHRIVEAVLISPGNGRGVLLHRSFGHRVFDVLTAGQL